MTYWKSLHHTYFTRENTVRQSNSCVRRYLFDFGALLLSGLRSTVVGWPFRIFHEDNYFDKKVLMKIILFFQVKENIMLGLYLLNLVDK